MSWNGSGEKGRAPTPVAPQRVSPSVVKGALGGLVAVVVVLAVGYFMFGGEDAVPEKKTEKRQAQIKNVTPAAAPTNAAPVQLTEKGKRQREIDRLKAMFAGKEMPKGIKTRIYYLENPPQSTYKVEVPHSYLRHPTERDIASVVLAMPGTEFLDVLTYGENFNTDFMNALVDKIEINADDDEETRRVKESVTEAKKEIARICREDGKKPNEVMNEYAKMMYDLGKFQRNLTAQLSAIRKNPDYSDEDVKDFYRAANKMREERGLEPLKVPKLASRAFVLARQAERQRTAEQSSK